MSDKLQLSDEEWRQRLTPEQFRLCRQKGTEMPFTGAYWNEHGAGTYHCIACGAELFRSADKYDSGSGWPSFVRPAPGAHLDEHHDTSHGMVRTEVTCGQCDAHLGHVFPDGPVPTGLRYCINSGALRLVRG